MRTRSVLVSLLGLAGSGLTGCGGPLLRTYQAQTPTPAPDVYACVTEQFKALGYSVESRDVPEQRITGRKYDTRATRPDVQFRRLVARLEVDVDGGLADGGTGLRVAARTFAEYTRHRGPTEEEEQPSAQVQADARRIVERCGGSGQ
ncbi:MAG TPA: hypothetical protein VNK43_01215 [Gemmatimonadales bacterium]|nr:hypothetical protein [Gemmatimonadales bacterium]